MIKNFLNSEKIFFRKCCNLFRGFASNMTETDDKCRGKERNTNICRTNIKFKHNEETVIHGKPCTCRMQ